MIQLRCVKRGFGPRNETKSKPNPKREPRRLPSLTAHTRRARPCSHYLSRKRVYVNCRIVKNASAGLNLIDRTLPPASCTGMSRDPLVSALLEKEPLRRRSENGQQTN